MDSESSSRDVLVKRLCALSIAIVVVLFPESGLSQVPRPFSEVVAILKSNRTDLERDLVIPDPSYFGWGIVLFQTVVKSKHLLTDVNTKIRADACKLGSLDVTDCETRPRARSRGYSQRPASPVFRLWPA